MADSIEKIVGEMLSADPRYNVDAPNWATRLRSVQSVAVDEAMVERALSAYYCHGISWQEAAQLGGDLKDDMRAALAAALEVPNGK